MKNEKQKIIVILGPTASGKSDLAVKIAKKINAEIVSADSRQIYKGLDIGTGKITKREMRGVIHHLLDVASPILRPSSRQAKIFNASDFKDLGEKAIQKILKKNKIPIICGGTGFYIDALLDEKQIPGVLPNPELRKKLEQKSTKELFEMLKKLDPERASNIDAKNPRRLIRAIEICEDLGRVPKYEVRDKKYEVLKIGIAPLTPLNLRREPERKPTLNEKELRERINKRLEKRIKIGMVAEAKGLHKSGLSYKRMRELGLEYKALADFLENKINKKDLIVRLQKEIWQYAKRQITYFKKDKNIIWTEPKIENLYKVTKKFLIN